MAVLILGAPIGALTAWDLATTTSDQAEYDAQTTGLRTDLVPMVTRFHRFGELESAQFVMHAPGAHAREMVPFPDQPYPLYAVLHLKAGQVKHLLDGRTSSPMAAPTFAADDLPTGGLSVFTGPPGGLPASLAPYVPANAVWVAAPELNKVLVKADGEVTVWLDPASDTAVVYSVNPDDPDEVKQMVDTQGHTSLVTPSPFALPS
ncbi:hypothetical protein ACFYST_18225 [Kitasatospora sp. NPDC004614]|uniref:hypothetical protein n=1 Tax=unclassified Kitasatospora TaxID=2633591 RepID=UPI003677B593